MNINIRGELYSLESPKVMGILNLTPDSFYDGGKFSSEKKILTHVVSMLENGMDILDVGGYSSRPGAKIISVKEEEKRVIPILKYLRKEFKDLIISVDTFRSEIARKSIQNGADIINDISAGEIDEKIMNVVAEYNIPYIIMHMKGDPQTMQKNPKYKNVLLDIFDYFEKKIRFFRKVGINHNNIILDPGIGFGKNLKHNLSILRNISIFHSLGFPVLLGISRKRFIKDVSENNDSKQRIGGTISSSLFAIMKGVQVLRVHDVNEVKQSIKVFNKLLEN